MSIAGIVSVISSPHSPAPARARELNGSMSELTGWGWGSGWGWGDSKRTTLSASRVLAALSHSALCRRHRCRLRRILPRAARQNAGSAEGAIDGDGELTADHHPFLEAIGPGAQLEVQRVGAEAHEQRDRCGILDDARVAAGHAAQQLEHAFGVDAVR